MKSLDFPSVARNAPLHLKVYSKADDALLFSSSIRLHVGDVSQSVCVDTFSPEGNDGPRSSGRFGFDLKMNDWVRPYGKGEVTDFELNYDCHWGPTNHLCTGSVVGIKEVVKKGLTT